MTATAWPRVVTQLLAMLPALPGWSQVAVYDTNPLTGDTSPFYAIVGRTSDDNTCGSYVRQVNSNGYMWNETGTVRVHVVTRTGDADSAGMRIAGFALVDALQDALLADQTLAGVLGNAGTVALTVDVSSRAVPNGVAQSLVVSVNYYALI